MFKLILFINLLFFVEIKEKKNKINIDTVAQLKYITEQVYNLDITT